MSAKPKISEVLQAESDARVNRLVQLYRSTVATGLISEAHFLANLNTDLLTDDELERARQMWSTA